MNNPDTIKKQKTIFSILGVLWFVYLVLRASFVPFTFDESATFFHFVHRGDFWFFTSLPDANNHFINTLLTYVSYHIFGSSKLALRIPNLLSAIIFLYYLFRSSMFIKNIPARWTTILSIMFAHFFVEFFALSRGYGLSMAFIFGAFYHLMNFSTSRSNKQLIWISFFLFLAELSNLSIIVLAIAIIGYQIMIVIIHSKKASKKSILNLVTIFVFQILPLIFASYYMFFLNEKGSLYYGDTSGFWNLTVQSLILLITGEKSLVYSIAVITFIALLLGGFSFLIYKKGILLITHPRMVFPLLLIATIIGIILLSLLFGINHPEDRVAMYFIPLFLGSITMVADAVFDITKKKIILIPLVLLMFFPLHFVYSLNLDYVNGYKTEVLPERFYKTIVADTEKRSDFPATIGGYRMRMFCWTYMNFQNGGTQNLIDYDSYPETQSDYQIVDLDEYPEWSNYYDVIDTENVLGRKLLKRKNPLNYKLINTQTKVTPDKIKNKYFRLADWNTDTLVNHSYLVTIDMTLHSPETPFHAWLTLQLLDNDGENVLYKYIPFDWLKTSWSKNGEQFKHSFLTGNIPANSNLMKIYIWNIDKGEYTIENAKVSLYVVK